MFDRRTALVLPLAFLAACSKDAGKAAGVEAQADMTLGNKNAKVTMIEYHSVACPACQQFALTVWPDFKKKYIDTGRVYYISREALTHDAALAAAGFLIAHCASGGDANKYFAVVDTLYHRQGELDPQRNPGADVRGILLEIARSAGMTEAQFAACVNDEAALELIQKRWEKYGNPVNGDSRAGTPTILINGKNVTPLMADLEAAVAAAEK